MSDIIVPGDPGPSIKVDGICYERIGYTSTPPETSIAPDSVYEDCNACTEGSSSLVAGEPGLEDGKYYCITYDAWIDDGPPYTCDGTLYPSSPFTECVQYSSASAGWPGTNYGFVAADGSCQPGVALAETRLVAVNKGPYDILTDCENAGCP